MQTLQQSTANPSEHGVSVEVDLHVEQFGHPRVQLVAHETVVHDVASGRVRVSFLVAQVV